MFEGLTLSSAAITLSAILFSVLAVEVLSMFKNKFPLPGKNVFIGGGSQGLGLSLACLLTSKGANVTIVSRSQSKLDVALQGLEKNRTSTAQRLHAISTDLTSSEATSQAFEQYAKLNEILCPDYVISCTGGAGEILGYFTDLTPELLKKGWETNYLTALWTAHCAGKLMVEHKVKGQIVLVSSLMGLFSFVGYAAYAPCKAAVRGLADVLRNEFLMYGIDVHCYFPGNIYSPGFVEEQKCKPAITKKIEEGDAGLQPEQCAQKLLSGLERGNFLITSDVIGHLFRNSMKGSSPGNTFLADFMWKIAGWIGIPIWRTMCDADVKKFGKTQWNAN